MLTVLTGLCALVLLFGAAAVVNDASDLLGHLRRSRWSKVRPPSFTDAYHRPARAPRWRDVVGQAAERRRVVIMLAAQAERRPARSHRELARYQTPVSA